MSDSVSAQHSPRWQPWQMDRLERRSPRRGDAPNQTPGRRREDEISFQLFELAKEEAVRKGYAEGHAEGLQQGYAEGEQKIRAELQQAMADELAAALAPIHAMTASFREAVAGLNDEVSHALVELALEAGEKLAGRALELKPAHILDDIEDLLADYPTIGGTPTLYVNVEDLAVIENHLADTLAKAGWILRADVNLIRGDCRIETDQRQIDARISDRWQRLLHTVGHGEH